MGMKIYMLSKSRTGLSTPMMMMTMATTTVLICKGNCNLIIPEPQRDWWRNCNGLTVTGASCNGVYNCLQRVKVFHSEHKVGVGIRGDGGELVVVYISADTDSKQRVS